MENYLQKYKQDKEAVIVCISSTTGTQGYAFAPVYTATKHAILGLVKSWGVPDFYAETKVRIIAICPGATLTPLYNDISGRNLGSRYQRVLEKNISKDPTQE